MSEAPSTSPSTPIGIADANLPVDGGLSGLGLLMSLVGAIFLVMAAGAGALLMFSLLLSGGGGMQGAGTVILLILAVITTSVLRSWAHRAAGQRLLYDGPGTPRSAMTRYFLFSALQTVLVLAAMGSQGTPGKFLWPICIMLAGWPIALMLVFTNPRLKALLDQPSIPQGEDKGFEGASILMVVLGLTGLLFGVVMAIGIIEGIGPILRYAPFVGFSMIVIVTMMLLRSWFHVRAGFGGVLEVNRDHATNAAAKYGNFAVLAAAVICGVMFLMTLVATDGRMPGPAIFLMLIMVVFVMWGLTTWPTIIKRFFVERQFADFLVSGEATTHSRAPDRGLTTLGWFLFGQAVLALTMALPAMWAGHDEFYRARDPMSEMFAAFQAGGKSQWWAVGAAALQLVASWQLIRMRPNHKQLVTVWGVAATLVAIYINYPMLKAMTKGGLDGLLGDSQTMLLSNFAFMTVAISLIAPIASLILVHRKQRELPTAVLQRY